MYCQGQEPQEQHHTHAKSQALSETCEEMADRGRGRNKGRGRNNRGDDGRDHLQDGNQVSNIGAPPPQQFYGFGHPPHTHMDVQWCLWRSVPAHTHTPNLGLGCNKHGLGCHLHRISRVDLGYRSNCKLGRDTSLIPTQGQVLVSNRAR